jgi:hypothetical protein
MSQHDLSGARKVPLSPTALFGPDDPAEHNEVDIAARATIHFSAEDPAHPVEHMLDRSSGRGASRWSSGRLNVTEELLLVFDEPVDVRCCSFEVEESEVERTQEIRAEYSIDDGVSFRTGFVQEYTFSPRGATYQRENLRVDWRALTHLRLIVVPNRNGAGVATVTSLRLF